MCKICVVLEKYIIFIQYSSRLDAGVMTPGEFVNTVMSVVEGITQHPTLLMEHGPVVMDTILPTLAELAVTQNGNHRHSFCVHLKLHL